MVIYTYLFSADASPIDPSTSCFINWHYLGPASAKPLVKKWHHTVVAHAVLLSAASTSAMRNFR